MANEKSIHPRPQGIYPRETIIYSVLYLRYREKKLLGKAFVSDIITWDNIRKINSVFEHDIEFGVSLGINLPRCGWLKNAGDREVFDNLVAETPHAYLCDTFVKDGKQSYYWPYAVSMFDMDSVTEYWIVRIDDKLELRQTNYCKLEGHPEYVAGHLQPDCTIEVTDPKVIKKMENTIQNALEIAEVKLQNKTPKRTLPPCSFSDTYPQISKQDIQAFEQELGVKLPASFVKHYLAHNGGIPSCPYIYCHKSDTEVEIQLFSPFKHADLASTIEQRYYALQNKCGEIMRDYLPFAQDYGANPVCLNLKNGKIYVVWMDLGTIDKDCMRLLADSFPKLLNALDEASIYD